MNRANEQELLDFCARQKESFSSKQWQDFSLVKKNELAAAALFLAGSDWYGHRNELLDLVDHLFPGRKGGFAQLEHDAAMDCGRFSNMLKARLNHEQSLSRTR